MVEMTLAGIFLKAFILMALLYLLARDQADYDFPKVAMVSAGILLVDGLSGAFLKPHLGPFVFVPVIGGTLWIIKEFCWLTWRKALLVTAVFFAISIGMNVGVALFWKSAAGPATQTRQDVHAAEVQEAAAFMRKMYAAPEAPAAAKTETPPAPAPPTPTRAPTATTAPVATLPDTSAASAWAKAYLQLKIGGVMHARGETFLVVDGTMRKAGERVSTIYEGKKFTWQVTTTGTQTDLEPVSAVPLVPSKE